MRDRAGGRAANRLAPHPALSPQSGASGEFQSLPAGALLPRSDRNHRFGHRVVHLLAQTVIGEVYVAALEVRPQRGGDVVIRAADLSADEFIGVYFRLTRREPILLGDPERQRLVASRNCPEMQVLVVDKLLLESVFAILECVGHHALRLSSAARARSVAPETHLVCHLFKAIARPSEPKTSLSQDCKNRKDLCQLTLSEARTCQ